MSIEEHERTDAAKHERHSERIVRLETGQEALMHSVTSLSNLVGRSFQETQVSIKELGDKIGSHGKMNYPSVFAGVALFMAAIAAIFAPLNQRVSENEQNIKMFGADLKTHEALASHPVTAAIFEEREKAQKRENELQAKIQDLKIDELKMLEGRNSPHSK